MRKRVAVELIYIHETETSILVRDEETAPLQWIDKRYVWYDEDLLQPGKVCTFEISEGIAIANGYV